MICKVFFQNFISFFCLSLFFFIFFGYFALISYFRGEAGEGVRLFTF